MTFVVPSAAIARSTERGCHVACALIGTNCTTWLALRRVAAGVATATGSAVAPRKIPSINYALGRGKIVPRK